MTSSSEKAPPPVYEETSINTVPVHEATGQPVDAVAQAVAAIEGNAADDPSNATASEREPGTAHTQSSLPSL